MNKKFTLPKIKNELYLGIFILMLKVYGEASSILSFYNDTLDTILATVGIKTSPIPRSAPDKTSINT